MHLDLLIVITESLEVLFGEIIKRATLGGWSSGSSGGSSTGSHLDWNAATEWTSASSVLAADHADVLLSSDGTSASLTSWDSGLKWEIHLGVGAVVAVLAIDLCGDIYVGPVVSGTIGVDRARVWACTITIDLVKSHADLATSGDLWELIAVLLHDCLGASLDVVLSTSKSLTASSLVLTLEASRVLLEGVSSSSITWSGWVNSDGGTLSTCITNCLDDGTVTGHQLGNGEQTKSDWEVHPEPAGRLY